MFELKILLTGANGFIGTYICKNSDNTNSILYGTTSDKIKNNFLKFESLYANIEDVLKEDKVDCIIHNASIIPDCFENATYELFLDNTTMMNNIYNYATKNNIKKFIYMSSFGSMQYPEKLDIGDYYTMSKISGEHFCSMMNKREIDAVSFRISAPYGEYLRKKTVLKIFVDNALANKEIKIFGTGKREQNFTYVGDIYSAIRLALNKKVQGVYDIVGKKNISMYELAKLIIYITNSKSEIVFSEKDEQENYRPNYSHERAFRDFNYNPLSLEAGLRKYINWYVQYEDSYNI